MRNLHVIFTGLGINREFRLSTFRRHLCAFLTRSWIRQPLIQRNFLWNRPLQCSVSAVSLYRHLPHNSKTFTKKNSFELLNIEFGIKQADYHCWYRRRDFKFGAIQMEYIQLKRDPPVQSSPLDSKLFFRPFSARVLQIGRPVFHRVDTETFSLLWLSFEMCGAAWKSKQHNPSRW